MADLEDPLLKKRKRYPNCPGCKAAHLAVDGAPPPYRHLFFVSVVVLCNVLPICSLYPYVYFMVRDFGIAKADEDIGFYAGYIGSSFMFGRFLTSLHWGIASDKFGRRPVMMVSIFAVIVFNTIFGASSSFWMAILSRFLLGCFNGALGPVKAYASEICSDEHQAVGVSTVGTSWGLGLILGPAIGGYLSQPALKYPTLFPPGSLFDKFPYLLPSLTISGLAVVGLFITLHLPETAHIHREQEAVVFEDDDSAKDEAQANLSKVVTVPEETETRPHDSEQKKKVTTWSLLRNWPLMASINVYCLWSLHDMAYTEIFSLYAVSPKPAGGLGLTTTNVGNVLTISGAALLAFQVTAFPKLARRLGAINTTRAATVLCLPLLLAYTPIARLRGAALWVAVIAVSVTKNVLGTATFSGAFLLINNSVRPSQRAAANGLSVSVVSLFKAIGPGAGGALFAWAQSRHSEFLPGNEMVFFVLSVIALVAAVCSLDFCLPRRLDRTMHEEDEA